MLKPLAKVALIPLRLTAEASATDAVTHEKRLNQLLQFGMRKWMISWK